MDEDDEPEHKFLKDAAGDVGVGYASGATGDAAATSSTNRLDYAWLRKEIRVFVNPPDETGNEDTDEDSGLAYFCQATK